MDISQVYQLPQQQFRMWELYYQLEPYGPERFSAEFAHVVSMIYNMAVKPEDRKPLSEFLLSWGEDPKPPKPPQTFEEQIAIAKIMAYGQAAIHQKK